MRSPKKLKVLHLATHLNVGGITRYMYLAAGELTRRGHSVSVATGGGECAEDFKARGIGVRAFGIRTKNELHPKLLLALVPMIAYVRRERFDVLHAHTRVTQILSFFISKATGVPYVSTAHGYYKRRIGRRLWGAWGARVIAVSPLVAQELEASHAVDASRIAVIMNAIDRRELEKKLAESDREAVRRQLGIPQDGIVVGAISRLVKDKGHDVLIGAASRLKDKFPKLVVVIIGEGRERAALEALARERGIADRTRFLGTQRDVAPFLAAMDIFAHPATFREGFGLSVAEAMAARLPVIATDIWAINAILENGKTGILVPPKSEAALADAIRRLIERPAEAKALAERGYRFATEISSLDRMGDELENVYRAVIEEK